MQELVNVTSQTPLEVVLGIDKDGMTTARKLYSFLGMDNKNYSRWCKNNITENEFAEENVDYWCHWWVSKWKDKCFTCYFRNFYK